MHRLITTSDALAKVCAIFSEKPYVAVDTEFVREKTYYPKLCLVQVTHPDCEPVAIDPLADKIDLTPLFTLLSNHRVLKVFHAAKQDLEIFFQCIGAVPHPLYDTQVAAMVCGFGEQIGYEALVNTLVNETLDKASRYTDWEQRPLTQRQIDYAIGDVTHLCHVYEALRQQIEDKSRSEWIRDEMLALENEGNYRTDPDEMWRRLKYKNRSPAHLNVLRALAAWRERTAQQKDVPRGRLLKDDIVLQIAGMNPSTMEELLQVRGAMKHLSADNAKAMLQAMNDARALPQDQWPRDEKKRRMLSGDQEVIVDLLKLLLKLQCEQAGIASKLVANKDDLAELVLAKDRKKLSCMQGWRYELFGRLAEAFMDGKLGLSLDAKGRLHFNNA